MRRIRAGHGHYVLAHALQRQAAAYRLQHRQLAGIADQPVGRLERRLIHGTGGRNALPAWPWRPMSWNSVSRPVARTRKAQPLKFVAACACSLLISDTFPSEIESGKRQQLLFE
jgi:hypothetical protein